MSGQVGLFPLRVVTLRGIQHELDESGHYCTVCGELVDYLIDQGGTGAV